MLGMTEGVAPRTKPVQVAIPSDAFGATSPCYA